MSEKITIEAELDGNSLTITECPWGRGELKQSFVIKKWEIVKGGIAAQIDYYMKTQLIPAKEELRILKNKFKGDLSKNSFSSTILRRTEKTLRNIKKINESITEQVKDS